MLPTSRASRDHISPPPAGAVKITAQGLRFAGGGTLVLGFRSRRVVQALAVKSGRCVAYAELLECCEIPDCPRGRHLLEVLVSRLRRAAADMGEHGVVCTDRGHGYALTRPVVLG